MCVPVSPVATFCEEEAVDVTHQTVTYGVEDEYDSPLVLEELPEPVKVGHVHAGAVAQTGFASDMQLIATRQCREIIKHILFSISFVTCP